MFYIITVHLFHFLLFHFFCADCIGKFIFCTVCVGWVVF